MKLVFKKYKGNYEVTSFDKGDKSSYRNIIDRDAKKLSQVFLDLYFQGFPIVKAFRIMQNRLRKRDWLGI